MGKRYLRDLGVAVLIAGLASIKLGVWIAVAIGLGLIAISFLWERRRMSHEGRETAPTLISGPGGSGLVGGGSGGVAYGEGAHAEGGKGGTLGSTAFATLARAAMELGYHVDEFIRLAGFDPDSDELDRIGAGGDGGAAGESGEDGGSGLVVVSSKDEGDRTIQVDVFSTKGHFTIPRKDQL